MSAVGVSGQGEAREPLDGARLYVDCDMAAVETERLAAGQAAVFSARCPTRDGTNQDSAALIPCGPTGGVLAVADGLGGQPAGDRASSIALRELRATVEAAVRGGVEDLRPAILDGIEAANHAILDLGVGAATTLAVAEVQGNRLRSYHVGDSLILIVGQRGRIKLQTVSHSPVGYAVESGILDEREAMHHEDRHLISNLVGSADMRVELGFPLVLAPRDTVLLATDGLVDNIHSEEIVAWIRTGALDRAAGTLADQTLRRMREHLPGLPSKPDDLTFVLFRLARQTGGSRSAKSRRTGST